MQGGNRKLWAALSALSMSVGSATADENADKAGVVSAVNPMTEGTTGTSASRVLFVGSDVYRDEMIRTSATGQTHLLFQDRSSLTIGPDSEVILDHFVYNPDSGTGELALSATRGALRFVGGSLSKSGDVSIKTNFGTLGIRGGAMYVRVRPSDVLACLFYGDYITGTSELTGKQKKVDKVEYCLMLLPDGVIREILLEPTLIDWFITQFTGPDQAEIPNWRNLPLVGEYPEWDRQDSDDEKSRNIGDDEDLTNYSYPIR